MTSMQALEDAEVRRNTAQSELAAAEARVVLGAPAAAPHRGARAVRRRGQRPQGLRRRHRAGRQGAAQGDRPAQHALRGPGLGRPHARAQGRPGASASASTAIRRPGVRRQGAARRRRRPTPTTRQVEVLVGLRRRRARRAWPGLYAEGRVETGTQRRRSMLPEARDGARRRQGRARLARRQGAASCSKVAGATRRARPAHAATIR